MNALDERIRHHIDALAAPVTLDEIIDPSPVFRLDQQPGRRRPTRFVMSAAAVVIAMVGVGGIVAIRVAQPVTESRSDQTSVTEVSAADTVPGPESTPMIEAVEADVPVYTADAAIQPQELIETDTDWNRIEHDGFEAAIASCMDAAGFSYVSRPFESGPSIPAVRDESYRRTYGYSVPASAFDADAWARFEAQLDDPRFKTTFMGDGDEQAGGCQIQALHQLYPPNGWRVPPNNDQFLDALNDWYTSMQDDPFLVAAQQDWSNCMTDLGYRDTNGDPYPAPDALAMHILQTEHAGQNEEPPTPSEIAAAVDDWTCQRHVDFVNRWYGRQQELTADFASANSDLISSILAWQAAVADRAQAATANLDNP